MKKLCVFIIIIYAFCFSFLFSVSAENIREISVNIPISVDIVEKSELLKFSPSVSGVYRIESVSRFDVQGVLYNEEMEIIGYDDDSGDTSNFAIESYFEKNKDYYICVEFYNDTKITVDVLVTLIEADEEHVHSYSLTYSRNATCTENGEKVYTCVCGNSFSETITKKEHNYSKEVTSPTCTAKGSEKLTCKTCGEEKVTVLSALGHSYSSKFVTDKVATCTAKGSKSKHCTRCDKRNEVTEIPAKGHSFSTKWTTDKKSTLSASGSKSHHCTRCTAKTDVTTIPKISAVTLSKTQYTYNGENKKPSVTIKDSKGKTLKSGTDYDASFPKDLKNIGSHSVKITFKGLYSGSKTLSYKIIPGDVSSLSAKPSETAVSLSWKAVKGAQKYRIYKYIEKTKEYVKICDVAKTSKKIENLKDGTYYIFVVRAFKTVDSKDYISSSYTKVKTATLPKKTKLSVKADGRQAVLSWKAVNAKGYEIFMADSKNGSYSKIKSVSGTSSYTKSSLKLGKIYYFKIRAYRKVGDSMFYGPYSDVVSVKIK